MGIGFKAELSRHQGVSDEFLKAGFRLRLGEMVGQLSGMFSEIGPVRFLQRLGGGQMDLGPLHGRYLFVNGLLYQRMTKPIASVAEWNRYDYPSRIRFVYPVGEEFLRNLWAEGAEQ